MSSLTCTSCWSTVYSATIFIFPRVPRLVTNTSLGRAAVDPNVRFLPVNIEADTGIAQ